MVKKIIAAAAALIIYGFQPPSGCKELNYSQIVQYAFTLRA
ncbi:hypothetical protein SAMN02745216_01675 [Desulfatibacillum alkenivorans DSM 16219]|uniref:Uncharacterized protein n=1 Tax=Desulfatibacillum alkenivorans DSM 16219 TaxID=1121393 RepID=A0A1M6JAF4_9BACT|nr:hypothetical protein SAMN02745216_01675 [Desulfatibacillum alkenivorans DSM 16219]